MLPHLCFQNYHNLQTAPTLTPSAWKLCDTVAFWVALLLALSITLNQFNVSGRRKVTGTARLFPRAYCAQVSVSAGGQKDNAADVVSLHEHPVERLRPSTPTHPVSSTSTRLTVGHSSRFTVTPAQLLETVLKNIHGLSMRRYVSARISAKAKPANQVQ